MKKANIIRSIFWGIIALILLFSGIMGTIYNNQRFNERKNELNNIIIKFNKSNTVKNYIKAKTYILAELDGKKIKITHEGLEKKEYIYNLKNGYLETKLSKDDSDGKVVLMVLTDSIAVNKGQNEGNTYPLFKNNEIINYTLENGIEFNEKKDYYIVKINLNNYIINNSNNYIQNKNDEI